MTSIFISTLVITITTSKNGWLQWCKMLVCLMMLERSTTSCISLNWCFEYSIFYSWRLESSGSNNSVPSRTNMPSEIIQGMCCCSSYVPNALGPLDPTPSMYLPPSKKKRGLLQCIYLHQTKKNNSFNVSTNTRVGVMILTSWLPSHDRSTALFPTSIYRPLS